MTTNVTTVLDALADLYRYPTKDFPEHMLHALEVVAPISPEALAALQPLAEFARTATLWESEELHVRTFDLNPVCALEVGWQVYGEKYSRGTFLVRMRELSRETHVDPGTELADHLTNVLAVAGRVDAQRGARMASSFALPALEKMREAFKDSVNPYAGLLDATTHTLRTVFEVEACAVTGGAQ